MFNENIGFVWYIYFEDSSFSIDIFQFEGGVVSNINGTQLRQLSPMIGSPSQTVICTWLMHHWTLTRVDNYGEKCNFLWRLFTFQEYSQCLYLEHGESALMCNPWWTVMRRNSCGSTSTVRQCRSHCTNLTTAMLARWPTQGGER